MIKTSKSKEARLWIQLLISISWDRIKRGHTVQSLSSSPLLMSLVSLLCALKLWIIIMDRDRVCLDKSKLFLKTLREIHISQTALAVVFAPTIHRSIQWIKTSSQDLDMKSSNLTSTISITWWNWKFNIKEKVYHKLWWKKARRSPRLNMTHKQPEDSESKNNPLRTTIN